MWKQINEKMDELTNDEWKDERMGIRMNEKMNDNEAFIYHK